MRPGLRLTAIYGVLLALDLWAVPRAENSPFLNVVALFSIGIRVMLPCIITGAYAFSTTTAGELVCALRSMHVPESVIIPCAVVIRFFPTVGEDYRQIRAAMALRGIAEGKAALLLHPAQSLEYILMPLLMNGNNVAQDLSVAALTKGIGRRAAHQHDLNCAPRRRTFSTRCSHARCAFLGRCAVVADNNTNAPLIETSAVGFTYQGSETPALQDVTLSIGAGECVLLCGKSGCGKTTFTRLLNGLAPAFFPGRMLAAAA